MNFSEVVILIPSHSLEDFPSELGEKPAASLLNVFAVAWHPVLLLETQCLPKWLRADTFTIEQAGRLFLVPTACDETLTAEWAQAAQAAGAHLVRGIHDRQEMVAAALQRLDQIPPIDDELVKDFLALGTCWLLTELLTRHMRNYGSVDEVRMKDEALNAARAAVGGDAETARRHLKHAFELLLESRERFYPVPCYLLDLVLAGPNVAVPALDQLLGSSVPANILLCGQDLEKLAETSPPTIEKLKTAIQQERADLVGGDWREGCTQLLGINSILGSLQRGRASYESLVGQAPTIWGRRRFGVNLAMPQLLTRSGFAGGLHFVMDDGIYPDDEQTRYRWEGQDATVFEAYSRIPLAGDSASALLRFPVRMAESMDHDHVAAVCFARWPDLRTPWLDDLRRMGTYAPVLGKFTTFSDFFASTDTRDRYSDLKSNDYLSPSLVQAVARQENCPIQRYAEASARRMRFDRAAWCGSVSQLLRGQSVERQAALEQRVELAGPDRPETPDETLDADLTTFENDAARRLAALLVGPPGRQGVLVINTLSFARRSLIDWPVGVPLPPVADAVVAVCPDAKRPTVLADLPPCGFLWLPADRPATRSAPIKHREGAWAEELSMGNEFLELRISPETGGIADLRTPNIVGNRLSQQLAHRFPTARTITVGEGDESYDDTTYYSTTVCERHQVLQSGPGMSEIETEGRIVDPQMPDRVLATFRQRVRLWRARPLIEVEFDITPVKPLDGEPWTNYYAARWAWKKEDAALTKGVLQSAQPVHGERLEAPDYVEIADESQRVALLTAGLPFHRRSGPRMLDTLLLVAGEPAGPRTVRIVLDQPFPMQAAISVATPPVVIPVDRGPAASGPSGWLFHLSTRNVVLINILPHSDRAKSGCVLRLLETEGRAKAFKVQTFRRPTAARQCDFIGGTINTLGIDADGGVIVDIGAFDVCDLELTW
jgi:alpha-mannosidase